jgi:hypothetical protein
LRNAIAGTKDFPGVTGNITIDSQRNANKSAVIITIKNGEFHYLEMIEPKSSYKDRIQIRYDLIRFVWGRRPHCPKLRRYPR